MRIAVGSFSLDTLTHVLTKPDGAAVSLSPLASQLLQVLAGRPGKVIERTELVRLLWRDNWAVGDPALSRVVSEIRSAIDDDPKAPSLIQTIPRKGYRIAVTDAHSEQALQAPDGSPAAHAFGRMTRLALVLGSVLVALILAAALARALR